MQVLRVAWCASRCAPRYSAPTIPCNAGSPFCLTSSSASSSSPPGYSASTIPDDNEDLTFEGNLHDLAVLKLGSAVPEVGGVVGGGWWWASGCCCVHNTVHVVGKRVVVGWGGVLMCVGGVHCNYTINFM